jgi:hypothetical protein
MKQWLVKCVALGVWTLCLMQYLKKKLIFSISRTEGEKAPPQRGLIERAINNHSFLKEKNFSLHFVKYNVK